MSFIRLENEDVTISAESITSPAWGENVSTLTTFFSSSFQSGSESGEYHLDIYSADQGSLQPSGSVNFSIAHAISGSALTPEKAVWEQYTTLLYGSDKAGAKADLTQEFFIINVNRSKYKESIAVTGFELATFDGGGASIIFEINDTVDFGLVDSGRKFVLKSEEGGALTTVAGFLFPDVGIIAIKSASFTTDPNNLTGLLNQLNAGGNFTLFSEETISSNFVFIRARNSQLNYSTNPSFVKSDGTIREAKLVDTPQVFPTTVGLYNDSNELIAVAKLSRPLIKDFNKEALLRVKLDY